MTIIEILKNIYASLKKINSIAKILKTVLNYNNMEEGKAKRINQIFNKALNYLKDSRVADVIRKRKQQKIEELKK